MNKIIIFLLISGLMLSIWPVFAQPTVGFPMDSTFLTEDTALAIPAGKEIYGYTLWATTAGGYFGLFDCKTLPETSTTTVISEDVEATDEASVTVWFPKPLVTTNGCSVIVNTANLTLYHQK